MTAAQIQAKRALVDADYPPRAPLWWRLLVGAAIAVALGVLLVEYSDSAFSRGDSYARGDYADMVNDCYSKNRTGTVDTMYSCIANHD